MKFATTFLLLSSLSLILTCKGQNSQIRVPEPGGNVYAGRNNTVQITRMMKLGASREVGIAIGLLPCNEFGSPCENAEPGTRLGSILYTGPFNPIPHEGGPPGTLYQNFSLYVPRAEDGFPTGLGQLHVARLHLIGAGPTPVFETYNISVTIVSSRIYNIHPNGDTTKCISILGGTYQNGSPVDIYDCNGSPGQKWQWVGNSLASVNPADESQWCLDAGLPDQLANGVKMKIWQCYSDLPQQSWNPQFTSGPLTLSVGNYCLDLTNGDKTNRNILQVWTCAAGNKNQNWSLNAV